MSNNWDISLGFHIVLIVYWAFVRGIGRRRGKLAPGYKLIQNATNRYMQDREFMKTQSFSGVPDFPSQDTCVVEGEGPIQDGHGSTLSPRIR